jgi:uncharacterized membrane protein
MEIQSIIYWTTISMFLINIGIFALTVYVLFGKWYQASHRYISDLPFILGLTYVLLISDRMDSILGLSGIMPITQVSQLINILGFVVIFAMNLIIMLTIWIPKRTRVRLALMTALVGLWILMIAIFITMPGTIHSVIFFSSLPMLLLMALTWYFCYFQKRLSIINPLLVGIGTTGILVSTLLKAVIGIIGTPIGYVFTDLHWIALSIDIISYTIMLLGFSKKMTN